MKKICFLLAFVFVSVLALGSDVEITIEDFKKAGVSYDNVKKLNGVVNETTKKYKGLVYEKRQKELEIDKLILVGAEKNLNEIYKLYDELGDIESNIRKNKLSAQIEVQKYITREQYLRAKQIAEARDK